ncbi:MAG: DNA methyltransferase [Thermoplasmatota archaeon]
MDEESLDGEGTRVDTIEIRGTEYPTYTNEFWTSKQRQGSSLHEISYRACFKPQLPRFFMDLLTGPGAVVLDPFSGRGTTVIEAGLTGRPFISNDINPLSTVLSKPRFRPPTADQIRKRLDEIDLHSGEGADLDLSMFYHPDTMDEVTSLRNYLVARSEDEREDHLDEWIRMVATNRLTGHSRGFFSVYTLPPNQAVTPERQIKINRRLAQDPPYRDVSDIILRKTKMLLRSVTDVDRKNLSRSFMAGMFLEHEASDLRQVRSSSVDITITSPPFLNIVQYSVDNWLRCWFNGLDAKKVEENMTMSSTVNSWKREMEPVFSELHRVTRPGGYVAFEVGEVRNRKVNLDEVVIPLGTDAGFSCFGVVINSQTFTKTSNIWGIDNNRRGTNTNRIVLFEKVED